MGTAEAKPVHKRTELDDHEIKDAEQKKFEIQEQSSKEEETKTPISKQYINRQCIVLGSTGVGKSTIINMLINNSYDKDSCLTPALTGSTVSSVTKEVKYYLNLPMKRAFIDTIGLGDPELKNNDIISMTSDFLQKTKSGVNVVIVVARFGRWSKEERANMGMLYEILDSKWEEQSVLILTNYTKEFADKETELKNWINGDQEVTEMLKKFKNILITDNDIGRNELTSRPFREKLLSDLNTIILLHESVVPQKSSSWFDIIRKILGLFYSAYKKQQVLLSSLADAMKTTKVKSGLGECPICLDEIDILNVLQTDCKHSYHIKCYQDLSNRSNGNITCVLCRKKISNVYTIDN